MFCLYFRPSELKKARVLFLLKFNSYTLSVFRQWTAFCRQELFFQQSFCTESSFPITARTFQAPGVARLSGNSGCEETGPGSSWHSDFRGAVPRDPLTAEARAVSSTLDLIFNSQPRSLRTASHRLLFPLYPSNKTQPPTGQNLSCVTFKSHTSGVKMLTSPSSVSMVDFT